MKARGKGAALTLQQKENKEKSIPKLVRITTVPLSLQTLISGQMNFMSRNGFNVYMISSDFKEKEALIEKEQSDYLPVEMTRKISPFADLVALYRLVKIFRKLKPAIVHSHTPKAGLLGMLAGKLTGVPVRLHTVAGLPLLERTGAKRALLVAVEKVVYHCATKVYPNSLKLRAMMIQANYCKAEKLKVIGRGTSNGICTATFKRTPEVLAKANELQARLQLSSQNFTFIFVGRLVRDKGVEELVEAFKNLQRKYPEARLILLGHEEADLDPLSAATLKEMHENPAILLTGFQADVRPYFAISQVLVLPSYREGFPNVPMQAGCFNLPCIVTDINGCNEIIFEGENGLLIPVKDSGALEIAMEQLLNDKKLYQQLSCKARALIIERFEQAQVWELILAEYREHLKQKGLVS
jgi:glycosyltransferase involved in cell wall biosynthesis